MITTTEVFKRVCPLCGREVFHKTSRSLYISKWKNSQCKRCHSEKKLKNKCEILINESLESYYWLGFLFADGHFETPSNNISINIHEQDKLHLLKLKDYLFVESLYEYPKVNQVGISFANKDIFKILNERYSLNSNKTKNPPNIFSIKEDKLKAFNIGFIDGDGCISNQPGRKDLRITIRVHSAWLENLKYMFNRGKIGNDGYAKLCIAKMEEIRNYKRFIIDNSLPHLERKWDKVLI